MALPARSSSEPPASLWPRTRPSPHSLREKGAFTRRPLALVPAVAGADPFTRHLFSRSSSLPIRADLERGKYIPLGTVPWEQLKTDLIEWVGGVSGAVEEARQLVNKITNARV
jgi:hypothetical protein